MNAWRVFLDWGEAGAVMFFDVPSILMGFFAGVIITLLVWNLVSIITRWKKHE